MGEMAVKPLPSMLQIPNEVVANKTGKSELWPTKIPLKAIDTPNFANKMNIGKMASLWC